MVNNHGICTLYLHISSIGKLRCHIHSGSSIIGMTASHRGCKHAFVPKKELKVLSIPKHSITSEASVLLKIEIRNSVLLEIAGNTHSPFCQYFADYSACVLPALQKDSISDFIFGKN